MQRGNVRCCPYPTLLPSPPLGLPYQEGRSPSVGPGSAGEYLITEAMAIGSAIHHGDRRRENCLCHTSDQGTNDSKKAQYFMEQMITPRTLPNQREGSFETFSGVQLFGPPRRRLRVRGDDEEAAGRRLLRLRRPFRGQPDPGPLSRLLSNVTQFTPFQMRMHIDSGSSGSARVKIGCFFPSESVFTCKLQHVHYFCPIPHLQETILISTTKNPVMFR